MVCPATSPWFQPCPLHYSYADNLLQTAVAMLAVLPSIFIAAYVFIGKFAI